MRYIIIAFTLLVCGQAHAQKYDRPEIYQPGYLGYGGPWYQCYGYNESSPVQSRVCGESGSCSEAVAECADRNFFNISCRQIQ